MARVTLNSKGMAALLRSPGVRNLVHDEAEKVAARARTKTRNKISVHDGGRSRARSYVRMSGPNAVAEEVRTRALGGSL